MRRFSALGIAGFLLVLAIGWGEDWYGRTDYAQDAISYLNVSHELAAHEWKTALNPLWSIGYPLLICAIRPLFPSGAYGEWDAVHLLNEIVFAATYLAFLFALSAAVDFAVSQGGAVAAGVRKWVFAAGTLVFLCTELTIDTASRVGPDLPVSCLFFAGLGVMLGLVRKPRSLGLAILLGAILGVGYWMKMAFLPAGAMLAATLALWLWRRKAPLRVLVPIALTATLLAAPYAAAMSWALGRFTLGESGSLNYAIHVNRLRGYAHWQGGPSAFGNPTHGTRKLLENPPVFEFGEPFHSTYPPFNNLVYWYDGFHRFWSPRLQILALGRGLYHLFDVLLRQPMAYFMAILVAWLAIWSGRQSGFRAGWRVDWRNMTLQCWPLALAAIAGILLYVVVHLEGRYIASFLAILAVVPLVSLASVGASLPRRFWALSLAWLGLGAALNLAVVDREALMRALHRASYREDPQWKVAEFLRREGLKPGDKVASINLVPAYSCTWAEADGLRIVAEIGSDAYDRDHPERNSPLFWRSSAAVRQQVYDLFRRAGAVAVIAPSKPGDVPAPGWRQAANTGWWVYPLR